MNRFLIAAAAVISVAGTGVAQASPKDALDDIADAMDIVEGASGGCYRGTMSELTAIQQLIRDGSEGRALGRIRSLKRSVDRCPRAVGRLLRSAEDALEEDLRDRRDRRRDRRDDRRDDRWDDRSDRQPEPKPEPPKRASGVPYADFTAVCVETWMIHEIARDNTTQGTMKTLGDNSAMACSSNAGFGAASYPNGQLMHTESGTWYYPNGQMAHSSGTYYYPNGQMAKGSGDTWYYPNGQMAKAGGGTWYYPNGTQAGTWQVIEGWACTKAGDSLCKRYRSFLASDVADWRTYALVQLATHASRAR